MPFGRDILHVIRLVKNGHIKNHFHFFSQIRQLEGVQGVQETHFWTLCSNYYCGGVKLEVSANADQKYIVSHTQMIFRSIGVTQLFVQLDYEYSKNTYQNLQSFT